MSDYLDGYGKPDYDDDLDDYSPLDDDDELEDLDLLEDPDLSLDEDDVEISMEIDADGNKIYHAQDEKVPDSRSQGYSAEEAIEGIEQRRREYREMLRRSKEAELDDDPEQLPGDVGFANGDGVDVSLEIDEDGNERWYATDPKVPGSASMGRSAEEAVDGLEERRSEFREMLRKSRAKSKKKRSKE